MTTTKTHSGDGTGAGNDTGKSAGPSASDGSIIIGARPSPELSELLFSIDTLSIDAVHPADSTTQAAGTHSNQGELPTPKTPTTDALTGMPDKSNQDVKVVHANLTEEEKSRRNLLAEASRYISNSNPAEPLDDFPERGSLVYRQIAYIKLFNTITSSDYPLSEESYNELGRSKGILSTLAQTPHWEKVQTQPIWSQYLAYTRADTERDEAKDPADIAARNEAKMAAAAIKEQLVGQTVEEYDPHFGDCGSFKVGDVHASKSLVRIIGRSMDDDRRVWEADVKVLTFIVPQGGPKGGRVQVSNAYGSTLTVTD
jgi:hypothetical protein